MPGTMTPEGGLQTTTDHGTIRRWTEDRSGRPAIVRHAGAQALRIDFPGYSGEEGVQPVSWDEFFAEFDRRNLAFVHGVQTGDSLSRYFRFVARDLHPG